jgi:hypothetical protein
MPGLRTTESGWEGRRKAAAKAYGVSAGGWLDSLRRMDAALSEADALTQAHPEVTSLRYDSQRAAIDKVGRQGDGLTRYAGQINDALLMAINDPYVDRLDSIIDRLAFAGYGDFMPKELHEAAIAPDHLAALAGGGHGQEFMDSLQIAAAKREIDRLIREGMVTLDDPDDLDELLGLEDLLSPEALAVIAATGGSQEVIDILTAYFEKQVRIQVFEHGAIHDYVKRAVAMQVHGNTEVYIRGVEGNVRGGFMDIYNINTGEVWEVKSVRQGRNGVGQIQGYVAAQFDPGNEGKFPAGVRPGKNITTFTLKLGDYQITVRSFIDPDNPEPTGIVVYEYSRVEQPQEATAPETAPVPVIVPSRTQPRASGSLGARAWTSRSTGERSSW